MPSRADSAYPERVSGHRVEASRVIAVEPESAFDRLLTAPLPQVFSRRYAAFPPVREVTDEPADWGTAGQSRTIVLADSGGRVDGVWTFTNVHVLVYAATFGAVPEHSERQSLAEPDFTDGFGGNDEGIWGVTEVRPRAPSKTRQYRAIFSAIACNSGTATATANR